MIPWLVVTGVIILIIIVVIALNCRSAKEFWSTLGAILGIVTGAVLAVVLAAVLLLFILGVMITGLWPWDPQFWSAGP